MGYFIKSSCVLCGDFTSQNISLCQPCQDELPTIKSACLSCGLPVPSNVNITKCGQCLKIPLAVDYTISLFEYESPVDHLIMQLKFNQKLLYAAILAHLLKQFLLERLDKNSMPDVILPVPLHKSRLVKRGFNQSLEIAKPVSKALEIPIDYQFVRRIKKTISQTDLNATERKKNIKGCFDITSMPAYKHVVIIDDVITTGSTINELAKLLKESGVETVGAWSIGRAKI